jgi:hypothetical protein
MTNQSRFSIKNKNTKWNIGGSILKVRGTNPLKNDQIIKKDTAPKVIQMNGKTSKQPKKRFRPVFRTSNRNKNQNNNKNSAAFIDTSQKTPSDVDSEKIKSGPKKNK